MLKQFHAQREHHKSNIIPEQKKWGSNSRHQIRDLVNSLLMLVVGFLFAELFSQKLTSFNISINIYDVSHANNNVLTFQKPKLTEEVRAGQRSNKLIYCSSEVT